MRITLAKFLFLLMAFVSLVNNLNSQEFFLLESDFQTQMKKKKIPGFALAIIEKGQIAGHMECGFKNSQTHELVVENTVFEAASLSKPVFAYAVLQMVESGLLNLDTPLFKYLPYPELDKEKRLKHITARMVLAHTAGFPNWRPKGKPLKIHFHPGETFSYSGEGYVYLQKVVEHLTKQPLEEYLKQNVFHPLGMSHSSFIWKSAYEALKASGHDIAGNPEQMTRPQTANAAYTLHTTALDYAKFVMAIMKNEGLKPESTDLMLSPQIKVNEGCISCTNKSAPFKLSKSVSWGLGWGLQLLDGSLSFWHWGDNPGFKCYTAGIKEQGKGIVILTNSTNGLSIMPDIIEKIWGGRQPALEWLDSENSPYIQKN